jgi:hypothetical protein
MIQDQHEMCALKKGLERAATELGSQTVAVLVVEGSCIEIAYPPGDVRSWPAAAIAPATERAPAADNAALDESRFVPAGTPVARFLASIVAGAANEFLMFPWRAQRRSVIIVFGFAGAHSVRESVPAHVAESLNLAALAASSLTEVDRLRAELRTVNDRFAGRKLVERAKCVLQAERGMDEQQAYEHLRKMSRQRRIPMAKLAEGLLAAPRKSLTT